MEQDIITRNFVETDMPQIAALACELGYPTTEEEMSSRMKNILQNEDYKTVVIAKGHTILGFIGMFKCFYWERNGCYIRIQSLVVSKDAKRLGIGKMLIQAAEKWGHETGALTLSLNCGHKAAREAAHQFYPQMGFLHSAAGYTKEL